MLTHFIELKALNKEYITPAESYPALKNINLSISTGEFIALMGASGSGKSTLMNIIGLLDTPTSGSYSLEEKEVSDLDINQLAELRNQTIGFIFQGFNLLPRTNLLNNVALPLVYAKISKEERYQRALSLLQKVGLKHRAKALPNEISGGEQQRVAIARALVMHPKLILADEPTGNLDSKNGAIIMKIFSELNSEGITIFLVTHEADIAAYAKRLIHLKDGVIVSDVLHNVHLKNEEIDK